VSDQEKKHLTPMLSQYKEIKSKHPDALVFFRLGDFYELFFEDAELASKLLDLVLTGRGSKENRAPMCGVPHHAVTAYIQKLVDLNYSVAMVEQLEDPALSKGLVKRDVVRIITPGTNVEIYQDEKRIVRIASIEVFANQIYLILCELISGETLAISMRNNVEALLSELMKYQVKEVIGDSKWEHTFKATFNQQGIRYTTTESQTQKSSSHPAFESLQEPSFHVSGARLIHYLENTQKQAIKHLKQVQAYIDQSKLFMDYQTSLNLELIEAINNDQRKASLYGFLDVCETAMGSRLLKQWILNPLNHLESIQQRQHQIQTFIDDFKLSDQVQQHLHACYDLSRIVGRLALGSINPQDLLRLKMTLNQAPKLKDLLVSSVFDNLNQFDPLTQLTQNLNQALNEEQPIHIKEGNVFKEGYHLELDELRSIEKLGKNWIIELEAKERLRTGIKNLRVGYNRVFGYYLEVSKGNVHLIKEAYGYTRKQTLSNQERYITSELKEMEDKILHAQERSIRLEEALFQALVETCLRYQDEMQVLSDILAEVDVLLCLSRKARQYHWIKPQLHTGYDCEIIEGKHPILDAKGNYVSNSTTFRQDQTVQLLTGPNMGGKSTYMRQVALLFVLAQMGSFIPAKQARMPLINALYTRMGASDDIMAGQSTFMVEMLQANVALQNADQKSLILFDEIGRGTSTYDGMALALAMVEYISSVLQCKCIFSTHYHELTQLDQSIPSVENIHVEVYEEGTQIEFLYRIKAGKANRSYGIHVAELAHLPSAIIQRAQKALGELESSKRHIQQSMEVVELVRIPKHLERIQEDLDAININETTPLEALKYIDTWKKAVKK
jgi:DNA mismatch repair protein MutS